MRSELGPVQAMLRQLRGTWARPVIRSSAWTVGGYGAAQALRFVGNVILTRLLFPEAFGLMILVNTLLQGLQMFSDIGIGPSIIRSSRGEDPAFLNTAWSIQVVRGLLLSLVSVALAWPLAAVFAQQDLVSLVPAVGVTAFLSGLTSTNIHTATRRLRIGRVVALEITAQAVALLTMVAWASLERSVWALAAGSIAGAGARAWLSYYIGPDRNRPQWDDAAGREMLLFGRAIFLSTAVLFAANQSERLILGHSVTLATLGVYGIAYTLATMATSVVQMLMTRVVFPSLSRLLREDPPRAILEFSRLRRNVDLLSVVAVCLGAVLGPLAIRVLYDHRYWDAGWMLRILLLQTALDIMRQPAAWLLVAAGKPWCGVVANLLRIVVLWAVLPLALLYSGMTAAVWVISLSALPPAVAYAVGIARTYPQLLKGELVAAVWVALSVLFVLAVSLVQ